MGKSLLLVESERVWKLTTDGSILAQEAEDFVKGFQ
jgi:hypothetical protein